MCLHWVLSRGDSKTLCVPSKFVGTLLCQAVGPVIENRSSGCSEGTGFPSVLMCGVSFPMSLEEAAGLDTGIGVQQVLKALESRVGKSCPLGPFIGNWKKTFRGSLSWAVAASDHFPGSDPKSLSVAVLRGH